MEEDPTIYCDFKMIFPFSTFFTLRFVSLLGCCYFVSDDNMEIHTYWYSNGDLRSQTEAKNYVNTNVLTGKINHNLQATWISWGKRGKDVGYGMWLETSWSQKMEHHPQKLGNIYKHNFLVTHKQKMQWFKSRQARNLTAVEKFYCLWKLSVLIVRLFTALPWFGGLFLSSSSPSYKKKKKSLKNMNLGKANFMCC